MQEHIRRRLLHPRWPLSFSDLVPLLLVPLRRPTRPENSADLVAGAHPDALGAVEEANKIATGAALHGLQPTQVQMIHDHHMIDPLLQGLLEPLCGRRKVDRGAL